MRHKDFREFLIDITDAHGPLTERQKHILEDRLWQMRMEREEAAEEKREREEQEKRDAIRAWVLAQPTSADMPADAGYNGSQTGSR